jgi:protein involved in polysaccharide export with SLBB domain
MQLRSSSARGRLQRLVGFGLFALCVIRPVGILAQGPEPYTTGERKRLLIMVHLLGYVQTPGEYTVPDDTHVLGLIAKAGGTTEYGDLSAVRITHSAIGIGTAPAPVRYETVDLKAYLEGKSNAGPPVLQPGDVIIVPRNSWWKWRSAAAVMRDLSVVATAVFLGIRTFDNNP